MELHTPAFAKGDSVLIPRKNLGHDHHDPTRRYQVTKVIAGPGPSTTSYLLKGLTFYYPETRLKK